MQKQNLLLLSIFCCLTLSSIGQPLPTIKLEQVFTKLQGERPVWLSEFPDGSGRICVVYQEGRIILLNKGSDGSDAKEFLNIVDRNPFYDHEDGLLGIAFHPGFKTNKLFYVYYNQENPKDQRKHPLNYPFRSVISEFKVSTTDPRSADMSSERILLEVQQPYSNHKGGQVSFGPDGYLYIGLGDGGRGDDPFGNGQSTATLLGKILRIDVNSRAVVGSGKKQHELPYGIPPDNPFVAEKDMGDRGAQKEIYAYGFRNPWRFSWDLKTGDLWVGDVGQGLWEEVDLVIKGGNYGWSVREGAHHFKPGPPGAQYVEPVMEYPHNPNLLPESLFPDHTMGLCVVGGYVYHGRRYPELEGVYIYGDYNLGTIWGFRYDRATRKVTEQSLLLSQPKNITSFGEDAEGELYVLTQDRHIYSITVAQETATAQLNRDNNPSR